MPTTEPAGAHWETGWPYCAGHGHAGDAAGADPASSTLQLHAYLAALHLPVPQGVVTRVTQLEPGAGGYPTATIQMTDIMERGRTKVEPHSEQSNPGGLSAGLLCGSTRVALLAGRLPPSSNPRARSGPRAAARRSCTSPCRWTKCCPMCSRPHQVTCSGTEMC